MSAGAANWQLQLFLSLLFVWSSVMNWRHVQGVTPPSHQDRPLLVYRRLVCWQHGGVNDEESR